MLFHTRTYDDPSRDSDSHYLAAMEVWSETGKEWLVQYCLPGCLPDGDAMAFDSPMQAFSYCYESADYDYWQAFRFFYCGALHRLRGDIALAQADEARSDALVKAAEESENDAIYDGLMHIEGVAHEAARAVYSSQKGG